MQLQKLPIGIQTFSEIRKEDYVYVDKTEIDQKKEIYLVGIEFDTEDKNISNFEWEKYK